MSAPDERPASVRRAWSRLPPLRKVALGATAGALACILLGVIILVAAPARDDASPQRTSPAASETQIAGMCLTGEEERYLVVTFRETALIGAALGALGEHFLAAGDQPSLFADDDWRSGVFLALSEIETGSSNLQAIDPPTARTEAIHRHLTAAATHYHEGIRLAERALDTFDVDTLDMAANAIRAGGEATEWASTAVQSICSQATTRNSY